MDVQGAEIHALRGARETIRAAHHLSLVVEMHPQCWPAFRRHREGRSRDARAISGLTARPLVEGEELFARDTHAVLDSGSPRLAMRPFQGTRAMSGPAGDSFRTKTLSERIAAALPAGGRFAACGAG